MTAEKDGRAGGNQLPNDVIDTPAHTDADQRFGFGHELSNEITVPARHEVGRLGTAIYRKRVRNHPRHDYDQPRARAPRERNRGGEGDTRRLEARGQHVHDVVTLRPTLHAFSVEKRN
jgi:hypothetical protein